MAASHIMLSENGPTCSRIVHGLWRLAEWRMSRSQLLGMIRACLDMGVTTFDHADIYGEYTCEGLFGETLAHDPTLRHKMQLVTKCGIKLVSKNRPQHMIKHYDTSKGHVIASVENSLRMLRTDHIDLLLIHRPHPLMDARETAEALASLRQSGKVLHVGVSNFTPDQFDLLASRLNFPLVTNQVECSAMNVGAFRDGTVDMCQGLRICPMAWSPLARGRVFREESEQAIRLRNVLSHVGEELGGASIDHVALAWLLNHPAKIVPVVGTGKRERIRKAVEAESLDLSREEWFAIWCASTGREIP